MEYRRLLALWLSAVLLCAGGREIQALPVGAGFDFVPAVLGRASIAEPPGGPCRGPCRRAASWSEAQDIMNPEQLVLIMERFLRREFGVEEAEDLFGRVEDDRDPDNLVLKPKSEAVERAQLGMIEQDGQPQLSYIFVKFRGGVGIDSRALVAAYGAAREGVRLKPDQPIPHFFDVVGRDYVGDLMLGLEADGEDRGKVRTLRFSRIEPRAD